MKSIEELHLRIVPKWLDKLEEAVKHSICYTDVLKYLKLNYKASGNFQTIQKYIKLLEIDVSHFDSIKAATRGLNQYSKSIKYTDEQLFQKNSLIPKNSVRRRYKELVEYKCVICKLENSWQDKKLILQMDHINGDRTDHRLENLRWLCPNCHSQTETYGFKLNRPVKKIHKCLNCNKKIHPS